MDSAETHILVIDDDTRFRERLVRALKDRSYEATGAGSFDDALTMAQEISPTHAIIDLKLAEESGLDVLTHLKERWGTRGVILTGYGSVATALEAVRRGASNYLTKPCSCDAILAALFGEPLAPTIEGQSKEEDTPSLENVAWEHIQRVLRECEGNISHAAKRLGLHRQSLQRKLRSPPQ